MPEPLSSQAKPGNTLMANTRNSSVGWGGDNLTRVAMPDSSRYIQPLTGREMRRQAARDAAKRMGAASANLRKPRTDYK